MGFVIVLLIGPLLVAIAALTGAAKIASREKPEGSTGTAFGRGLAVVALVIVGLVGLGIGGCSGYFLLAGGLGNMH